MFARSSNQARWLFAAGCFIAFSAALPAESLFRPTGANFYILQRGSQQFVLNQNRLTDARLQTRMGQLSSAKRLTRASIDPAGLAVAEKLDSLVRGLRQTAMNAEDHRNYVRFVEATIAQNQELAARVRVLVLKAGNGILGPDDRSIIQGEIDQLLDQVDANARFSQFNRKTIITDLTAESLGLRRIDVVSRPHEGLPALDAALQKLTQRRVVAGASENTLTFQIKGKVFYIVNATASLSRISDLDMAEAMASLKKDAVLYRTAEGVLLRAK